MFMRHAFAGLPSMRTRTGSGLRQPGLMVRARAALTRMKGLIPFIAMTEVNLEVVMGILNLCHPRKCAEIYRPQDR